MPSRVYINIDFINYIAGFVSNSGSNTAAANVTSNLNFNITGSGANTPDPPNGLDDTVSYTYEATGDLDFTAFPAIPENALITEVEVKIDIAVTATASSSSTIVGPPSPCTAGGVFRGKVFLDDGVNPPVELTDISFEEIDENIGASPQSASVSDFDHYTATQTFDFTGAPIDRPTLIAQFTSWIVQLQAIWGAGADITGPVAGATSENSGFTFTGIRITVTYEAGIAFSMSPNIAEPGQTINVTGPNAPELTYAYISGNLVVPIIPKKNDEDAILEAPYPPTDDCTGCIATCPQCEACVDSCVEDLDSEACQECLQSCLDCLTDCLENLELAEDCQQSAPPGPGVVIVSGTQFSGSVSLGTLEILTAEASGIYRFVTNKTNDTLYSTSRDGETYDVKIPNPGGKTGFFRS